MKRALALLSALAVSCTSSTKAAPPPAAQPAGKPSAAETWKAVVGAPDRTEADRKLDPGRKPAEMLEFLDLKPGMKVADLGAGGGYTTELIARAVGPTGQVWMQNDPRWMSFLKDPIAERVTHPAMKNVQQAVVKFDDVLPPEAKGLDEIVINVIYHDIANMPVDRARMNKIVFDALRPGGAFVVIDSSAKDGTGVQDTQTLHRIDEQVVKDEVQKAGFQLVAEASFLRNPEDTRDWNSSPGAAAKAGKRGQSDRFALKFVRPEGSQAQVIPPRLRLPPGVRPTHVASELQIDPSKDAFSGSEQIDLALDAATPVLWLDATNLVVTDVDPKATVIDAPPDFVGLQFAQPLAAGTASVKIRWTGKVSATDLVGAFRQQENGEWYVLTQFEPIDARRVWPSFDEPSFKVPWKLSLRVPKAAAAYSNTPVEGTDAAGEEKVVRFAETRPLPSYLLAFGVGPFERLDAGKVKSGAPLGVVVTRGKAAWAKYPAQSTPKLMNLLEGYFQVPFHYPKLDEIEVPIAGWAMENAGLITYGQRGWLAKPGEDTPQYKRGAASVEAHECAHQWLGDMVTTAWWDDIWLNEAFATWMTFNTIEKYEPSWNPAADRVGSANSAMNEDRLLSARRIRQPIETNGDIETAFDGITYQKGAAVIRMFEQWVGPDKFEAGVTRYLEEHADGNATAKDFLAAVSAEAGRDVAPAFSTFLDQGGVPLVTAKASCEGGKGRLELSQSRYLPLGAKPPAEQLWQIPVCARTDKGRACTLLADKTGSLDLGACPAWVTANAGAAGYYRTALDDASLGALNKNVAKLTVPERMLHYYDAAAAARAGAVDEARVLELLRALAPDKDRHVVQALLPTLAGLREEGLVADEAMPQFEAYVRDTLGARAHALGMQEKKGESDDTRILRPALLRIVGDEGNDTALRNRAQLVALKWLYERKSATPELASATLFLAAIDGDAPLYDKLHEMAKKETDRIDRRRILDAMGEFRDPDLVQQGFQIFLSDEFDPRDASGLMWGPAGYSKTHDLALQFVEKNFDAIVKKMPSFLGDYGAYLPRIAEGFCDEQHAADAEKFFRPLMRFHPGGDRKLAQAVEDVRQCAAFREKQAPSVAAFLAKR
ncbi:MAG TPA: M1 family aminopeptidase [Myxococcales bacterium]|nr:M1 family aminopeptidase [Myxococcales bacterium]